MQRLLGVFLMIAGMAGQVSAQLKVDGLDRLASKATESVDITLDSNLLKIAGGFLSSGKDDHDSDAKELQKLLDGMKGIIVRSFKFGKEGQYRMEDLNPIREQLRAPGWSRIINEQKNDELSEIYTRTEQGKLVGFAIIAAEPKELTVISIEGAINLSDLSKLGALGVPPIAIPGKSNDQKGKK